MSTFVHRQLNKVCLPAWSSMCLTLHSGQRGGCSWSQFAIPIQGPFQIRQRPSLLLQLCGALHRYGATHLAEEECLSQTWVPFHDSPPHGLPSSGRYLPAERAVHVLSKPHAHSIPNKPCTQSLGTAQANARESTAYAEYVGVLWLKAWEYGVQCLG